jgi:hypothetical protein
VTDVDKKSVALLAVAFAAFYLVTQPENAADAVNGALDAVVEAVQAIGQFFDALAS